MTVVEEEMRGGFPVMLAAGTGWKLNMISEIDTGLGPRFVTLSRTLPLLTDEESTISFSGLFSEPVSAPAHTATAIANATATAIRITLAITGLTALRKVRCSTDRMPRL